MDRQFLLPRAAEYLIEFRVYIEQNPLIPSSKRDSLDATGDIIGEHTHYNPYTHTRLVSMGKRAGALKISCLMDGLEKASSSSDPGIVVNVIV